MKLSDYRKIGPAVNADLTAALAKHGLRLRKLNVGVAEFEGTVRYTIVAEDMCLTDEKGAATTPDVLRYRSHCALYDLKPEWLGQVFKSGGRPFTVLGLLDTRSDKCVSVEVDGKRMRMSPDALRRCAGAPIRATLADNLIA